MREKPFKHTVARMGIAELRDLDEYVHQRLSKLEAKPLTRPTWGDAQVNEVNALIKRMSVTQLDTINRFIDSRIRELSIDVEYVMELQQRLDEHYKEFRIESGAGYGPDKRRAYHRLAKKLHPDHGGDEASMKDLNTVFK